MATVNFEVVDGRLFLRRYDGAPELVKQINTTSRSYVVHSDGLGDAIRTGTAYLRPALTKVKGSPSSSEQKTLLIGLVHGHPEIQDGETIETRAITSAVLISGDEISTGVAKPEGTRIAPVYGEAAQGYKPG